MQQRRESATAIISRQEAISLGLKWYFTGESCPRGHVAKRTVSNRECRHCVNEKANARRAAGGCVELDKRRYARDIDGNREKSRQARLKHIEKRRAYDRERYAGNADRRERQKSQALRWAKANKGKRNHIVAMRRSWIRVATPPWVTREMVEQIRSMYLLARDLGPGMHVDHIEPLRAKDSCGLHVPWNLQIIPSDQNIAKGNRREA